MGASSYKVLLLSVLWGLIWLWGVQAVSIDQIGTLVGGSLSERTALTLSGSGLNGSIPPELGQLTNLTTLDLSNNNLSGSIPLELGQLINLKTLDLHNNSLSGTIPREIGQLEKLETVDLSYNDLFGPIVPELGQLSKLDRLSLNNNHLSGSIPSEFAQLAGLQHLYLYNNNLSELIPPALGNLSDLRYMYLHYNNLSGAIPPEIGNLANLKFLVLNDNKLGGQIPPELGNLSSLQYLYLYDNNLTGTIPPELGQLTNLKTFDLSTNGLSGPIPSQLGQLMSLEDLWIHDNNISGSVPPELSQLSNLSVLWLSSNNLSQSIPPELGQLQKLKELYLGYNNLSDTIPAELGQLANLEILSLSNNTLSGLIPPQLGNLSNLLDLDLTSTLTSCDGLDVSRLQKLRSLGIPCPPPRSAKETNIFLLQLSFGDQTTDFLDLSPLPNSCKIVNLTDSNPRLRSIRFWEGCKTGCVVSIKGTGAKLSRHTRRHICLNKISVFLDGDLPDPVFDAEQRFTNALRNNEGTYNLTDPNFVDFIDLGPDGRAYTGVGFTRVQAGNLCGNPEAKRVSGTVIGFFAAALVLATIAIVCVARWRRQKRSSNPESDPQSGSWKHVALYSWGAAVGLLPVVDLVTDILVLNEVQGAWPMWVVLASICAPFIVGAFAVASAWTSVTRPSPTWRNVRVRWLWPLPELAADSDTGESPRDLFRWVVALVLLPLGLLGVLVQDALAVVGKLGFHLGWGDQVLIFERYHDARVSMELLLESLPQAVFQTGLYLVGSSRATRIYIDEQIFVQSIVVSLLSLSVHYCNVLWEAVYENKSIVQVFLDRLRGAGQPVVVKRTSDRNQDEEILKGAGLEGSTLSAYSL